MVSAVLYRKPRPGGGGEAGRGLGPAGRRAVSGSCVRINAHGNTLPCGVYKNKNSTYTQVTNRH